MAALTPHFEIKHGLEQGEMARVAYTNFSKRTYQLSLKDHV